MHDIFHLHREFPHFPLFKYNEIWTHYPEGHTLQNIKKLSYWQKGDSCYEENSLKKKLEKKRENIYIYIYF